MTEKTKKPNYPKRVLITDEKLQFSVMRRIDELLHRERYTTEVVKKFNAEYGISTASASEIICGAKSGANLKIYHYTYFSKHFHFNLCNFFNPNMKNWDKEYTEIDEIVNAFKRMARAIEYAKYTPYILNSTNLLTNGDMYSVFTQPFYRTFRSMVENGYNSDSDMERKISINHIIRLSALSGIPTYAFFMVDDDAFESILEEKCITASEIFDRYASLDHFTGTRRENRRKIILENNTDIRVSAHNMRYPIMDDRIRRAVIDHFQMLKDSRDYKYSHIIAGTGLSKSIIHAVSNGLNSHLTSYLKVCDFFHVRINDFLDPNIKKLPTFHKKNMDIDFYTQFENAFKNARQNAINLTTSDETIQNLHSIWINFSAKPVGAYASNLEDVKEAAKHKIYLNTLIDFANAMNVTVYDLLSDESVEPENIEVPRLKPNRSGGKIKYVSSNMSVGRLPIDLRELIYDYVCLNADRKKAALDVIRFLATKQRAEASGDTEALNVLTEQIAELNK